MPWSLVWLNLNPSPSCPVGEDIASGWAGSGPGLPLRPGSGCSTESQGVSSVRKLVTMDSAQGSHPF